MSLCLEASAERYSGYKNKTSETETLPDKVLDGSWFAKWTRSNFGKSCVLCGSKTDLQMHHVKHTKDVKTQIRTGNSTYASWTGTFNRKQIPICGYHHSLYHNKGLTAADLAIIRKFR
jgi:hypothetical protein